MGVPPSAKIACILLWSCFSVRPVGGGVYQNESTSGRGGGNSVGEYDIVTAGERGGDGERDGEDTIFRDPRAVANEKHAGEGAGHTNGAASGCGEGDGGGGDAADKKKAACLGCVWTTFPVSVSVCACVCSWPSLSGVLCCSVSGKEGDGEEGDSAEPGDTTLIRIRPLCTAAMPATTPVGSLCCPFSALPSPKELTPLKPFCAGGNSGDSMGLLPDADEDEDILRKNGVDWLVASANRLLVKCLYTLNTWSGLSSTNSRAARVCRWRSRMKWSMASGLL